MVLAGAEMILSAGFFILGHDILWSSGNMRVDRVPYGGWENCLRIAASGIELIATVDVGPRIIRFGFVGGENEFCEYPDQLGKRGETLYRSYGGHRLWIAPEDKHRTYMPDNDPVRWEVREDALVLQAPVHPMVELQKELHVRLNDSDNGVRIIHRIKNCSSAPTLIAPWAISVMAPGGMAILPQEPFYPHPEKLLPVRPLVLWSYTNMADPRFRWGSRLIFLKQDTHSPSPQKIGVLNTRGWVAHLNGANMFVKKTIYDPIAVYPDFGCSTELFTNSRMLEVESLGPLVTLEPGQCVDHDERWSLHRGMFTGMMEDELEEAILALLPKSD